MGATGERQRMTGQSLDYREMGREEDREEGGGDGGKGGRNAETERVWSSFEASCRQARRQPSHGPNAKRRALNPDLFSSN